MAKIISLLIALVYLIVAFISGGSETLLQILVFLLLPLGVIWFGDELGGYTGRLIRLHYVVSSSPGYLVRFMGWVLLLLPAILLSMLYFIL